MTDPTGSNESDAKGATEEHTRKISSADMNDAFGNEHASEEHTGEPEGEEEEDG